MGRGKAFVLKPKFVWIQLCSSFYPSSVLIGTNLWWQECDVSLGEITVSFLFFPFPITAWLFIPECVKLNCKVRCNEVHGTFRKLALMLWLTIVAVYAWLRQTGGEGRVWMSKDISVLSPESTWSSSRGRSVHWGICPEAHYYPLTRPTSNCYFWKIPPLLTSEPDFGHVAGWRWDIKLGFSNTVCSRESKQACLVCQSWQYDSD